MSTRNFPVESAGLVGEAIEPVVFVMLDFPGDPKFVHSGVGIISWGREDWYGMGALGQIESLRDQMGLSTGRLRLSLSPVAAEYLNESINENTWGRLCEIHSGGWDGSGLVSDPLLFMRGQMGAPEARIGGPNSSIGIVVEDVRVMLDRVNGTRASLLSHQQESPGDLFYQYLPKMLDHKFTFAGGFHGGNNLTPLPPSLPTWPYY